MKLACQRCERVAEQKLNRLLSMPDVPEGWAVALLVLRGAVAWSATKAPVALHMPKHCRLRHRLPSARRRWQPTRTNHRGLTQKHQTRRMNVKNLYVIEEDRRDPSKRYWREVGVGFENSDGSINVKLYMFPGADFQLRDRVPANTENQAPQTGRGRR